MKKKLLAILLTLVFFASISVGCNSSEKASSGGGKGKKTTLKVWHNWPEHEDSDSPHQYIMKAAQEYMNQHQNIKIEVLGNQSHDKVLTALTGGQGPDVFTNHWPNIATWGDKGALLDITDYVNKDKEFDKDDFMPAAWKLTTYKDKILGVPYAAQSSELYYNIDVLKESGYDAPPETMEELIEMADGLTKKEANGKVTQLGFLPDYPWLDNVLWPVTFGAKWIDEDTNTITFDTPEMIAAYQWQADIYKKYGVEELIKFKSGFGSEGQSPFLVGKLAMMFGGEWVPGDVEKYGPGLNYGVAPIPYPKDRPELKGSMFLSVNTWSISSKTKNKDESWKFLSHLTGKESMKEFARGKEDEGSLISRISALNSLPDATSPQIKEIAQMIQSPNVRSFPMLPYVNEYLTIIGDEMALVLGQKQSVEEAAKKIVNKVQPLADKNPIK